MEGARYRLVRLMKRTPGTSQYMDDVMARIAVMSSQFDGAGSTLVNTTWKLYGEGSPYLGLWAAVDGYNEVVGHGLGDIEFWNGRMVAWISQVKMDGPAGYALKEEFMRAIDTWVNEVNQQAKAQNLTWQVTETLMMTPRVSLAWARHAGFDEYRTVFRRIVRGGT